MTVTVCIPAYRAGAFIAETVASVTAQTYRDLIIRVAIDPPADGSADDTAAALEPFLEDPRVSVVHNPERRGWAQNIDALLAGVETDYYAVLPHDDIWAPNYVSLLLAYLEADPAAVVAYGNLLCFGASPPGQKAVVLPQDEDSHAHLLRFLMQGAEAMPWRGITRRAALRATGGFPTDSHAGFAVECEYALSLLAAGRVIHVPKFLYFKRHFPQNHVTASRERDRMYAQEEHVAAWRGHCERMATRLEAAFTACGVAPDAQDLCRAALWDAMVRRYQQRLDRELDAELLSHTQAALTRTAGIDLPCGPAVMARLHLVLHTHHLTCVARANGDSTSMRTNTRLADLHLREALHLDADAPESIAARARSLHQEKRYLEALGEAARHRALTADAHSATSGLIGQIYRELGWTQAAARERFGPPVVDTKEKRRRWLPELWWR